MEFASFQKCGGAAVMLVACMQFRVGECGKEDAAVKFDTAF